ncbi:MAG: NAD(P)/FAD-dependent oxidoreductase [Aeromicrobium sp.]|uniref:dihydrolipoyl dehydrogenase family protein n=1 Tax=Aeromicrobium sp. TaxID=1871063 RepID=UPI002617A02E|nr:NAD(P)/FAD-dependent oxidoreductase [Aeromicrobium sp.]MDF1706310.1 NAD(P)/FAD-dependent oxidoreductase [Aeromicrobium sp.]
MSEASQQCDVIVIGTGPGGESLATRLAKAGLEVVAVESRLVGGECPYWGCIPSKMFIRAANALAEARRVPGLAGTATVEPDFSLVAARIREEATDSWDDTVAADRLTDAGVTLVRGHGRLTGPRTVQVEATDGTRPSFTARRGVVLNPGTRPAAPPIEGLADTPYWTNREALETETLPASLAVIGGGPIGVELAQAFARFGSAVAILQSGPRILAPEEPESSEVVTGVLRDEGVTVLTDVEVTRVEHDGSTFTVHHGDGTLEVDQVLVAAGRRPNIDDLGLETLGLEPGRSLEVDDSLRVAGQDGLWAIGDVVGRGAFTHVSMYQAQRAGSDVLGEDLPPYDESFPRTTFTDPEVGGVGLTEKQARDAGLDVRVGVAPLDESSRGFVHGPGNEGVVKVVVDAARGVLVGATFVGPAGGESVSGLGVAVRAEVPVDVLRNSIYAYPTFWRAVETALADAAG